MQFKNPFFSEHTSYKKGKTAHEVGDISYRHLKECYVAIHTYRNKKLTLQDMINIQEVLTVNCNVIIDVTSWIMEIHSTDI